MTRFLSFVVLAITLSLASSTVLKAKVVMKGHGCCEDVVDGRIVFIQHACDQPVQIRGIIFGLTPGYHGFHVHTHPVVGGRCETSGHHYNPFKANHGGPDDIDRHVGDLGNVRAVYRSRLGTTQAVVDMSDDVISLCPGPRSILNRTLVVHEAEDDLGRGDNLDSLFHGNSGDPVGCGIIQPV